MDYLFLIRHFFPPEHFAVGLSLYWTFNYWLYVLMVSLLITFIANSSELCFERIYFYKLKSMLTRYTLPDPPFPIHWVMSYRSFICLRVELSHSLLRIFSSNALFLPQHYDCQKQGIVWAYSVSHRKGWSLQSRASDIIQFAFWNISAVILQKERGS